MDTTAEKIFIDAIAISSPEERAAFIAKACADDAAVFARVNALVHAHDQAGDFLAPPDATVEPGKPNHAASPIEQPGTTIGRYKLLQVIGEGGFGTVYMAEQRLPIIRKVALKIIKLGMDTRQVVARFEAERQALAMMDHQHIAKVFDAGSTDSGRPYFVMELVRGVPITSYCDEHKLSVPDRLALFGDVCSAVQHAHQKGIIHRDIKPSNVLVTLVDSRPIVKIIDFGIAKATATQLTERTLFTEFGQMIGTPEYMSPEQADFRAADIDTRSDIYSLGVLLYELLVGMTPFDAKTLRRQAFAEMQRVIREVDPPRPSTRLSAEHATLASVAAVRQVQPERLNRLLRGELDWIVMKCLEKDPTRRYSTANDLENDLNRYLRNEAVTARPASRRYLLGKTVRKHRLAVSTAGLMAATVLIALGVSIHLLLREQAARRSAVVAATVAETARKAEAVERDRAEKNLTQAREIADIIADLAGSNSKQAATANAVKRDALEKIAKHLEALTSSTDGTDDSALALSNAYHSAGDARMELGQPNEAKTLYLTAMNRLQPVLSAHPESISLRYNMMRDVTSVHDVAQALGDNKAAERWERLALDQAIGIRKDTGDNVDAALQVASLESALADNLINWERRDEAVPYAADAVAILEHALAMQPQNDELMRRTGNGLLILGQAYEAVGQYDSAGNSFKRWIDLNRVLFTKTPNDPAAAVRLTRSMEYYGTVKLDLNQVADAQKVFLEGRDFSQQMVNSAPSNIDLRRRLIYTNRGLAYTSFLLNRHDEALAAYQRARAAAQWVYDSGADTTNFGATFASMLVEAAEPQARDPKTAISVARHELERWPRSGRLWVALSYGLYQTGDARGALDAMNHAESADITPRDATLYLKAILQMETGQPEIARQTYLAAEEATKLRLPLFWTTLYQEPARKLFSSSATTQPIRAAAEQTRTDSPTVLSDR